MFMYLNVLKLFFGADSEGKAANKSRYNITLSKLFKCFMI